MTHEVNAMGKQCPIPVVMTKKVIDNAAVGDEIEILIDNETAVNNLSRLANKTGCTLNLAYSLYFLLPFHLFCKHFPKLFCSIIINNYKTRSFFNE